MRRVRIYTGCALGFVSRMRIILSPFVSTKEIRSRGGSRTQPPLSRQTLQSRTNSRRAFRYAERTESYRATKALPSAAAHLGGARPPPPFRAKNKLRPPRRIICGLCRTVVTRNVQFTCRHQSYSTLFAPETQSLRL